MHSELALARSSREDVAGQTLIVESSLDGIRATLGSEGVKNLQELQQIVGRLVAAERFEYVRVRKRFGVRKERRRPPDLLEDPAPQVHRNLFHYSSVKIGKWE